MKGFKDLLVYKKAFSLSMDIYYESKKWPVEERYSLIDQIRRSSRSVCANLGEGYRKRRYPKHFVAKISDSDSENTETQVWLDYAFACKYLDDGLYNDFFSRSEEVGRMLSHMIENPKKYDTQATKRSSTP